MKKLIKWSMAVVGLLLVFGPGAYLAGGYFIGRALEAKQLRSILSGKTAKPLDCNAGYLPLRSNGISVFSPGFLAQASPPRALTEMRASRLFARCNLNQLWHGKWKIDELVVGHLQAAYGEAAATKINRTEFAQPELFPPLLKESPIKVDLHQIDIMRTDLFWGTTPEAGGEFRGVHAEIYPRDKDLVVHADGGTFQQAKWPAAKVRQIKLFYAKPNLRVDEATLTLGGNSTISVRGNFLFEQKQALDLQLTLAGCPVAPFLKSEQSKKFDGQFDGTVHLQKDATQTQSARAIGNINFPKAVLQNIEALKKVASFTGVNEIARLQIDQIKGDYDWNFPMLTVKNFLVQSKDLIVLKGEFVMKDQQIDGHFELGAAARLVDKFPGAREEVFTRSADGYLWTHLGLKGRPDHLHDDLKDRLVQAARNHFGKALLAPILRPGQNVIQTIEGLWNNG